jgi:hypothetical protein
MGGLELHRELGVGDTYCYLHAVLVSFISL